MIHLIALALIGLGGLSVYRFAQSKKLLTTSAVGIQQNDQAAADNSYSAVLSVDPSETPAPTSQQKLLAAAQSNEASTVEAGYAPAFGPDENTIGGVDFI